MKNILVLWGSLFAFLSVGKAQLLQISEKLYPLNWHELSYERDGVYGAEIDRAYELLEGKPKKQKVIVAVIDVGFDDLHEDLKQVLWINKREIPGNGIDDDKNGYVDDIHGWNFLADRDGRPVVRVLSEGTRLFLTRKSRYEELSGKQKNEKEEMEYRALQDAFRKSEVGMKYLSVEMTKIMARYIEEYDREMRMKFPGETLGQKHFTAVFKKDEPDTLKMTTHMFYNMMWEMQPETEWEKMFENRLKSVEMAEEEYNRVLAGLPEDGRKLIGDDIEDIKDKKYGNPVLISDYSDHGTHVAGIIGAGRGNGIGIDGIADNIELMLIRAVPNGDENDKDIALAIRYAVDNGAGIINMSFAKQISSHPEWVWKAMKYAEKKGVLLVHGAGNSFADNDKTSFYPTKYLKGKVLTNLITVGASDEEGQPALASNYGKKEVDVFAPGVNIYSTIVGDRYRKMGGTSMACPVVTGIAALLWTYYPDFSSAEIREILIRSAVTCREKQVRKPHDPIEFAGEKQVAFSELCVSGGIVNAYEAVKLAEERIKR